MRQWLVPARLFAISFLPCIGVSFIEIWASLSQVLSHPQKKQTWYNILLIIPSHICYFQERHIFYTLPVIWSHPHTLINCLDIFTAILPSFFFLHYLLPLPIPIYPLFFPFSQIIPHVPAGPLSIAPSPLYPGNGLLLLSWFWSKHISLGYFLDLAQSSSP